MAVGVGRDGRHLANEPKNLQVADLRIEHSLSVAIERRQRGESADEHAHGVRVVVKPVHERLDVFMEHGVGLDLTLPLEFLAMVGQFSEQNQPGHLEKVTVFGQLLDGVSAVKKNTFVSVDERNGALTGGGILESRVVAHDPEVVGVGFDLA